MTAETIESIKRFRIYSDDVQGADQISGNKAAKQAIEESITVPIRLPHLTTNKHMSCGGILLFGNPGTGKTMLAYSVAKEERVSFYSIDAASIVDRFVGASERNLANVFAVANHKAPSVIFIDEVHVLCKTQGAGNHEATQRLLGQLLICMTKYRKVLVIGATSLL